MTMISGISWATMYANEEISRQFREGRTLVIHIVILERTRFAKHMHHRFSLPAVGRRSRVLFLASENIRQTHLCGQEYVSYAVLGINLLHLCDQLSGAHELRPRGH